MSVKFTVVDKDDNVMLNDKKDTCLIVGEENCIFNIPSEMKVVAILKSAMVFYNAKRFMEEVAEKIEEISGINPAKLKEQEFIDEYKKILFDDVGKVKKEIEKQEGEKNVENWES